MSTDAVWHGHTEDLARLVQSADAHCSCSGSGTCATHQILADQHMLDHLAFARSVMRRLVEEEWRVPPAGGEARIEAAEWSALLRACTRATQVRVHPDVGHSRGTAALGAWVVSLVALVLILGVRGPGGDAPRPGYAPIASWQTR